MKKILITPKSFAKAKEKAYELLSKYEYEIIENHTGKTYSEEQMIKLCADVDGIIVGIDPLDDMVLKNAKRLKSISKYGAGLDNVDLKTAGELGIKVDRAVGTNATSVAELAVGLFFTLARNIYPAVSSVKNKGWERNIGCEIAGKNVGIIGMGAIGREVARIGHGLGMKVFGYDPYFKEEEFIKNYEVTMTDLETIYKSGDFITLHVPLLEETKYMIQAKTLNMMKETAYLINTSRGELVDENALYDALINGVIAGAAEDVFSSEPAGEHKLLTLDNFILTPHIGAYTYEATEKMVIRSTENLINMLENGA